MHLTDTATLTLTEREVSVVLHALTAYRRELRREIYGTDGNELPGAEASKLDMQEVCALTRKIRDAP